MAEHKKSFLLYADSIETIEELTNEEAGLLLKHILRYVNDLNPVCEDKNVRLAFIPIKQQLKRDLVNWETIKELRSKAGKASAEAKKNKKEEEQNSTESTHVEFVETESTQSTVTVTVNDTVINDSNLTVDWDGFREQFNSITGKRIRVVDEKSKKQIRARLKEGHDKDDLVTAIENCFNDSYHKETGYKYLTPEFISRPDKFQKYLNAPTTKKIGSISTQNGAL